MNVSLLQTLLLFFVLLNLDMWVVCLLYFGSSYNLEDRRGELNVFCVDLDGEDVGNVCLSTFMILADYYLSGFKKRN